MFARVTYFLDWIDLVTGGLDEEGLGYEINPGNITTTTTTTTTAPWSWPISPTKPSASPPGNTGME